MAQSAWRPTFAFLCGIALAVLPLNTLSVYVFHDVDKDKINKLDLAFSQLNAEMTKFATIAAVLFFLATLIGHRVLKLQNQTLNSKLAFFIGMGLITLQYLFDIFSRQFVSGHYDSMLTAYLLLGPVVCALILLRKAFPRTPKEVPDQRLPSFIHRAHNWH